MEIKNKKVLLMGLGILGGGTATARWLLEQGADLTVTDLKDENFLAPSLAKLADVRARIKWVLGRHEESDFLENDVIVINPDVPAGNKFVEMARQAGKQIENELTLLYRFSPSKRIVAVTGTRGKTTTSNWIVHFLRAANPDTILLGNSPEKPMLQEINNIKEGSNIVIEVPSYHLEIVNKDNFVPHVAVITNLYRDHINRHKTMEEYARTKANIFVGQGENDFLVLNESNDWTQFFLSEKPRSKVLFFSPKDSAGFVEKWGEHNLENLDAARVAAEAMGVQVELIENAIDTLPQIKFREEKVYDDGGLQIYNDTAATSPEAALAAMQRFPNAVFISGGTDRELDFSGWVAAVRENVKPENLILLAGSATEKMKQGLGWAEYNEFDTLEKCLNFALEKARDNDQISKIVFSPGAKSFEKFKNEFDRGEQFNALVKFLNQN